MNKVELIIKTQQGVSISVDILDFPYRLNRTAFSVSRDRLKSLGGSFSTQIKLADSKLNNKLFIGKTDIKSVNKFNIVKNYTASLLENGVLVMKGSFKLELIASDGYTGTFYDEDIDWVDRLSDVKLNQLGYVDGLPTWLVPFDGPIDFNTLNEGTILTTDFICPTLVYNNTPLADYTDLTDNDIWGTFELPLADPPIRTRSAGDYPNDFKTQTGYFGNRYGLTFEDFPPAIWYKTLIIKVFEEIGMTVDCSLFTEDWFNKLYMAYTGGGYLYNWKNLASVEGDLTLDYQYYDSPSTDDRDEIQYLEDLEITNITSPGFLPLFEPEATYQLFSMVKHDDVTVITDKINAVNSFNNEGQYICPASGQYTIDISDRFTSLRKDFIYEDLLPLFSFEGWVNFNAYATQEVNSGTGVTQEDRAYGWDDNVMIVLRKNAADALSYQDTMKKLYEWMSGENKDFIEQPSDVIAYYSPKRHKCYDNGFITNIKEAYGSPITDWQSEVNITGNYQHVVTVNTDGTGGQKSAVSQGIFNVTLDMLKNERVEILWVSLADIISGPDAVIRFESCEWQEQEGNNVLSGTATPSSYGISYNCGEEDLDLAQNLPAINGKDFIASFIRQFNLHLTVNDSSIYFTPGRQFRSPTTYDITSRVQANDWEANPIDVSSKWSVGYKIDNSDRFLTNVNVGCINSTNDLSSYGNVTVLNDNVYATGESLDYNIFSSTVFTSAIFDVTLFAGTILSWPTSTDPVSGYVLTKGPSWGIAPGLNWSWDVPSIQSLSSYNQTRLGDLTYDYNYTPRLLYHLGTASQIDPIIYDPGKQVLFGNPRATDYIREPQHWFRPTISQFDHENLQFGIDYPTLRYDTEFGMYNIYFENLLDLYNKSEQLTLKMSMRAIDWINMTGSKRIRFDDNIYRLMNISDYSPKDNRLCSINLLKEI